MTLRLSDDMSQDLDAVARVRGSSVANVIRVAVARHLASLAADEEFRAHMERSLQEEQRVLDRLVGQD